MIRWLMPFTAALASSWRRGLSELARELGAGLTTQGRERLKNENMNVLGHWKLKKHI